MKISVLISGEARFCKEFDDFLSKIQGNFSVDWFFYLWRNANFIDERPEWELISPNWKQGDLSWAQDKIKSRLPANHQIKNLEFANKNIVSIPYIGPAAWETNISRMFGMYYSLFQVDQQRQIYEKENLFEYDLVIRTRPDVGITGNINLEKILNHIKLNPNDIFVPNSYIYGYGFSTNDMIAIGNSKSMSIYCDLYNQISDYSRDNILCHPETMLAYHLKNHGINIIFENAWGHVILRQYGSNINGAYKSNFGHWD